MVAALRRGRPVTTPAMDAVCGARASAAARRRCGDGGAVAARLDGLSPLHDGLSLERGGLGRGGRGHHLRGGRASPPAALRHDAVARRPMDACARFSGMLDAVDLHPDGAPAQTASRGYRRWALESAALDLGLRQAGVSLAEVVGRDPAPVRFVVSLHLGAEPTLRAARVPPRAACSAVRFSSTPPPPGRSPAEALADGGLVEVVDFKGVYQGTLAEAHTDAELYRRVAQALPAAYLEDPDLAGPAARAALEPHRGRISWDGPHPQRGRHRASGRAGRSCERQAVAVRHPAGAVRRL